MMTILPLLFSILLLLTSSIDNTLVSALDCGGLLTKDCPPDVRFRAGEEIRLGGQSAIWPRLRGFWRVLPHHYAGPGSPCDLDDTSAAVDTACAIRQTHEVFPYIGYVNMTLQDTRFFQHAAWLLRGRANLGSFAFYTDSAAHSSFEKNGSAVFLDGDQLQHPILYPRGQVLPLASSIMEPVGEWAAARRTRYAIAVDDVLNIRDTTADAARVYTVYETWVCAPHSNNDCQEAQWTLETFDENGDRVNFDTGSAVRYDDATEWKQALQQDYERAEIPEEQQLTFLFDTGNNTTDSTTNNNAIATCYAAGPCFTNDQFCDSGDPACGHEESPYQDDRDEGQLAPGVVAFMVIFGFLIAVFLIWVTYTWHKNHLERGFRTQFVERLHEAHGKQLFLGKAMKDITAQDMAVAFNGLDRSAKGFITKGELTDYMTAETTATQATHAKPISTAELARLWDAMDVNGTNDVSFLEFCMFLADSHKQHAVLRNEVKRELEKDAETKKLLEGNNSSQLQSAPNQQGMANGEEEE